MLISSVLSICFVVAAQDPGDRPKDRLLAIPPGTSLGATKATPATPNPLPAPLAPSPAPLPPRLRQLPSSDNPFDFVLLSDPATESDDAPPSPRVVLPPSEFRDAEITGLNPPDNSHRTPQWCREVIEARRLADRWSFEKSGDDPRIAHSIEPVLRQAAYRQIAKAYDLSPREFNSIVFDRRLAQRPFRRATTPIRKNAEPSNPNMPLKLNVTPWGHNKTLFDPSEVVIPPKTLRDLKRFDSRWHP